MNKHEKLKVYVSLILLFSLWAILLYFLFNSNNNRIWMAFLLVLVILQPIIMVGYCFVKLKIMTYP